MGEFSLDEKLRILSLRAAGKTWEVIAEETHHRPASIIEVGRWFKSLPWEQVRALPEPIQRLHPNYLERKAVDLERRSQQLQPKVSVGTVVVPAENKRIYHGLGRKPSSVQLQLREGPVMSLAAVGAVTPEYFEAQAVTSGPIISWLAICFNTGSRDEPTSLNTGYDY